jgi:conjugative transfer signal peptidase TraF
MSRNVRNYRKRNYITPPILVLAASAVAICALAAAIPSARRSLFVWNASASVPIGLYRVHHDDRVSRGDLVLAIPDPFTARFAAQRGYLPMGVPLVKRIAGIAGDTICAHGNTISLNGVAVAARLATDQQARKLPAWFGCRSLQRGDVFLLMMNVPDSFDGRYFGPTSSSQIAGRLEPLWTR